MSSKHAGLCLCGAVRFEIAGDFERFYLCHCEYCRKDTGSALPDLQMNGALLKVPAGSLDTEVRIRPDAHIFVASRANWDDELEKAPRCE